MELQAQGRGGFNGVAGSRTSQGRRCHELGEDDGAASPGTTQVNGVMGLRMAWGAQHHGLKEDDVVVGSGTTSRAWERCLCGRWHHRLGSWKMATHKGHRPWLRMIVWRLRGGLDDGLEASGRTQRWHGFLGGRRWCRKFSVGNFGSLTTWVKASRD
jgi:hypothetical protein